MLIATTLLPSPLMGEGLGERGRADCSANLALSPTLPLSPTLSLKGRGGKTTLTSHV